MPIPADVISTLLAPMADDTRPFITTAQVRAADLRSDDIAELSLSDEKPRWRIVSNVYHNPADLLVELDEAASSQVVDGAAEINLSPPITPPGYNPGPIAPRPGADPLLIIIDKQDSDRRDHVRRVEPRLLTYALLETGKYVAVRFVREETDDGSQVEHGWMIAPWWHPVTIQVESTAKENA